MGRKKVKTVVMDDDKIDQIVNKYQGDAGSLIQILLDIQKEHHWLSKEVLEKVNKELQTPLPLSKLQHIASFYKAFSLMPKGRHEVQICMGTACYVQGAPRILAAVEEMLGIKPGETDTELKFSLETVNCLGYGAPGPVMIVDGNYYSNMTPDKAKDILKNYD
jgi:NADH-quinone oxidoreductase subunit E